MYGDRHAVGHIATGHGTLRSMCRCTSLRRSDLHPGRVIASVRIVHRVVGVGVGVVIGIGAGVVLVYSRGLEMVSGPPNSEDAPAPLEHSESLQLRRSAPES